MPCGRREMLASLNLVDTTPQKEVLWTFMAGQPVRIEEIDRQIRSLIPGPISFGERDLTRSDLRPDDQIFGSGAALERSARLREGQRQRTMAH